MFDPCPNSTIADPPIFDRNQEIRILKTDPDTTDTGANYESDTFISNHSDFFTYVYTLCWLFSFYLTKFTNLPKII
jgi:hypothetical protein